MSGFEVPQFYQVEQEREQEPQEKIDSKIRFHGEVLARFDKAVADFTVDENGKIGKPQTSLDMGTGPEVAAMAPLLKLIQERASSLQQLVDQVKQQDGVIDVTSSLGALIVTYDSSKSIPLLIQEDTGGRLEEGVKGFMVLQTDKSLATIGVDINQKHRKDVRLSTTASLVHELHHYVRNSMDTAIAMDAKEPMVTAMRQPLQMVEKITGKMFSSEAERFVQDIDIYESILGRKMPSITDYKEVQKVYDDISAQQGYLDELHSSFLQKKESWFNASEYVYSYKEKKKHHELVGTNPEDINAAKDLFCYLQGMYCANQLHAQIEAQFKGATDEQKRTLFGKDPSIQQFFEEFPDRFTQFGALLGVSRAVVQSERFAQEEWQKLRSNPFFEKQIGVYLANLETVKEATGVAGNGQSMAEFIMRKQEA